MSASRTLYEILDVAPDASMSDVTAGYQRAMEVFADGALASYALFSPDEAERIRREIQVAFSVLSHPQSRSAYDAALAAASDKAAATMTFTTSWELSNAVTISDSNVPGTRTQPRRSLTPVPAPPAVTEAVPSESSSAPGDSAVDGPADSPPAAKDGSTPPQSAPSPGTATPDGDGAPPSRSAQVLVSASPVEDLPMTAEAPLLPPPQTVGEAAEPAAPAKNVLSDLPPLGPAPTSPEPVNAGSPSAVPVRLTTELPGPPQASKGSGTTPLPAAAGSGNTPLPGNSPSSTPVGAPPPVPVPFTAVSTSTGAASNATPLPLSSSVSTPLPMGSSTPKGAPVPLLFPSVGTPVGPPPASPAFSGMPNSLIPATSGAFPPLGAQLSPSAPVPFPALGTPASALSIPPLPAPAIPSLPPATAPSPPAAVTKPPEAAPAAPAAPSPSGHQSGTRFKRVRLDDDHTASQLSRPVIPSSHNVPKVPDLPVDLPDKGEINGSLLQQLRESRGLDLKVMADITKVSIHYLRAIEANQISELPSRVYLRGFLLQYARALRLPAERLAAGYLAFADRYYKSQIR